MNPTLRCSVIVPAFNSERFLARTVDSVLAQTDVDLRLLIVNDGSTDDTPALVDAYARADARVSVLHQVNAGLAGARNAGLAQCQDDYVLFLDADDLLMPAALSTLASRLAADPSAGACHGRSCYVDEADADLPGLFRYRDRRHVFVPATGELMETAPGDVTPPSTFTVANCISSAGQVLIRRSVLAQVGSFDGHFSAVADWDLWYRLATATRLIYEPSTVLAYRIHGTSMSARRSTMRRDEALMRLLWLAKAADPAERRLLIRGQRMVDKQLNEVSRARLVESLRARKARAALPNLAFWLYGMTKRLTPTTWWYRLAVRRG